jgi:serine/threonine-protein kinase HipA
LDGKQTDGSSTRPIQWYFDNLLPEEKARELLAKDVKEPVEDVFALLTKAGAESAGAITLLPQNTIIPNGDIHTLTR